mmetsp:Transcript_29982/g.87529  ORF Transcript_29982/g.87529 Transcript_29982/m.87529 type:complete len:419 (-) Transcript_29982:68-1324(-)
MPSILPTYKWLVVQCTVCKQMLLTPSQPTHLGGRTELAVGLVVGGELVANEGAGAVGVEVVGHVVALGLHVGAHLVEGGGRDHVALAIDLPGDGGVLGADLVVAGGAGGGTGVHGNVTALLTVDDHAAEEVGVVVFLVVDDGEDLGLDADLGGRVGEDAVDAEDTVVEGGLVLVGGAAHAGGRVGPVDLVGLADAHADAVLPDVGGVELVLVDVVVAALVSLARFGLGQTTVAEAVVVVDGSGAELVVLASGVVLGAEMPVDVDGAHLVLPVGSGDGNVVDLHASLVALGDVAAGLRLDVGDGANHTIVVLELGLLAGAGILTCRRLAGGVEHIAGVDDDGGILGREGASARSAGAIGSVDTDGDEGGDAGDRDGAAEGDGGHEDLVVTERAGSGVLGAHGGDVFEEDEKKSEATVRM